LIQRYFAEPYRFVAPYRGRFWCRVGRGIMPRHLRRVLRVRRFEFQGQDLLSRSVRDGAGVLLAANHCRQADPVVLGLLGLEVGQFFYYLVSYHLFKQNRLLGWWLNRLGGYSVWREGTDREAIRVTADLLSRAERPVVMFPEGTWFRQNDRLGPPQEGIALMARRATRHTDRPVVLHPVAIKYWHLDDPRPAIRERLDRLETRLGWRPQRDLELVARVEKLGGALLAVKEAEHFGRVQTGTVDERVGRLGDALVSAVEKYHLGRETSGWILDRVRRLRPILVKRLPEARLDPDETARLRATLDTLLLCENLSGHSLEYLREHPSVERLAETVQRIEETVSEAPEEPVGDLGAVVRVGPALDARAFPAAGRWAGPDPLVREMADSLQGLLDGLLAQGPPPDWGCPPIPPTRAPRPRPCPNP
jgi:1-acyl-sn-glycerol-3-phosphate acyltransferase